MGVVRIRGAHLYDRARSWMRRPRGRVAPAEEAPTIAASPVEATPIAAPVALPVEAPTPRVLAGFHALTDLGAVGAAVVGYHVLLGWALDVPVLLSPGIGGAMRASSALAFLLAGIALWTLRRGPVAPHAARLASICTAGATALGLYALVEHGFGPGAQASMALLSALGIVVFGASLVCLEAGRAAWSQGFALCAGLLSLQSLVGYLYEAPPTHVHPFYSALASGLLAVGLFCARPTEGIAARVASDGFGGVMARRLLPAAVLIPIVLGWVQVAGQRAGLFTFEPGETVITVANVVVFVTVVGWSVASLNRMDGRRRLAERELEETAAKLQRSNADLEQFAYVTSHDLKEPLRAISGSIQVLQARFAEHLDPESEEFIRHTVDGANRMQTLIEDLLTYSRLTTREAPLEPTDCDAVLAEALANLAAPLEESRAVVTSDPLPTVPADRTQLLQVFQNLVSNALKYRSARTPRIHVSAEDQGAEWRFSVRDNGIGIAPQYADRIFKIFQRLHTRRDYPGTGIGLAVCKKVVERHGGRIWVESEPEEGSTFSFTLPK